MRVLTRLALWALLMLAAAPALSRHHGHRDADDGSAGVFDYYLLSLSWSPNYCLTHQGDRAQCDRKGLGFVLHGLWPQFDAGNYPQYCPGERSLPAPAAALGQRIYPSPKLVQHEWESHGTCSGLDAANYFRTADRALASLQVPAMLEAPPHNLSLSVAQLVAAFRSANPGLPEHALAIVCRHGQLSEVRVCLTRELALRTCGARVDTLCPDGPVEVRSSR